MHGRNRVLHENIVVMKQYTQLKIRLIFLVINQNKKITTFTASIVT